MLTALVAFIASALKVFNATLCKAQHISLTAEILIVYFVSAKNNSAELYFLVTGCYQCMQPYIDRINFV